MPPANPGLHTVRFQRLSLARIWEGGGQEFFSRFGEAMRFARGVRGHAPRNILKMVQFGVYFDPILSLNFFEKYHFYIKNKYFRYTLAIVYYSWRNFENMLRLMRISVYFENKIVIFI